MENGIITGKYNSEELNGFPKERLNALSLRTLDLDKITVPEKARLPETALQAVSVVDLSYTYGKKAGTVLSGISFSVREHEIVGLVGANGCGKTTAGKLIAGLCRPSGGCIKLFGKARKPKQLQKQALFIMQEAEFQFFTNSVLHELQYGHKITPEFEKRAELLLKKMGMWECRNRHPYSLSGGQMQRLTLMMAYLSDKPVVVPDEPTAGQDAESLERCAALIREMREEKTVLIITHDLELIAGACDRCIGLADGRAETEFHIRSEIYGERPPRRRQTAKGSQGAVSPRDKAVILACFDGRDIHSEQQRGIFHICGSDFAYRSGRLVRNSSCGRSELCGALDGECSVSELVFYVYPRAVSEDNRGRYLNENDDRQKRSKPHAGGSAKPAFSRTANYDNRRDFPFFFQPCREI